MRGSEGKGLSELRRPAREGEVEDDFLITKSQQKKREIKAKRKDRERLPKPWRSIRKRVKRKGEEKIDDFSITKSRQERKRENNRRWEGQGDDFGGSGSKRRRLK